MKGRKERRMTVKELINELLNFDMNKEVVTYICLDEGMSIRDLDFHIKETKLLCRPCVGIEFRDDSLELVTRCEDCKYYREPNEMMRSHYCWLLCEDVDGKKDYCSRAEWKEE